MKMIFIAILIGCLSFPSYAAGKKDKVNDKSINHFHSFSDNKFPVIPLFVGETPSTKKFIGYVQETSDRISNNACFKMAVKAKELGAVAVYHVTVRESSEIGSEYICYGEAVK